jgi:hypothetical protein
LKNLKVFYIFFLFVLLCSCHKNEPKPTPVTKPVTTTPPVDTNPPTDTTDPADYHKDGDVAQLYTPVENAVNIVVLGDGFIHEDLKKGGNFDTKVKETIDYLFTVAPFSQYKQNFNVYMVYAESQKRGATRGYYPSNPNSKFNAYYDSTTERLLIAGNSQACYTYAQKALPQEKINLMVLLVNDDTYGGSGGGIAVVSTHPLSKYIMVHEIGHTFAGLGDEYVDAAIANNYPESMVPYMANIDITNSPINIKWAHYYTRPLYEKVGAFEGAYYRAKGFYRPEQSSVMLELNQTKYNAPSREAIARMICSIRNVPFDLDAFLAADAVAVTAVSPRINTTLKLPQNDFIHMEKRIMELQKIRKQ